MRVLHITGKSLGALLLGLWLLLTCGGMAAAADAAEPGAGSPAAAPAIDPSGQVDTSQVEAYWNKLMQQYGGYFPESRPPTFRQLLAGGAKGFSISGIFKGVVEFFFHEVLVNGKLLATIVILTIFAMILETLQGAFEKNTVSKVAYAISYLVLIVIAVNSFHVAIDYAKDAIGGMIEFMIAVVPVLLTLLASTGSLASVSVLHPVIVFIVHAVGTTVYFFVFPLVFFSAILDIVSSLSDKYKLTQLAGLLRTVGLGVLGFAVTVFLGVISVQGATGAVADGVTLRTAKFVAGSFVPVVGRMFADATDTVIGASLLVKNAIGLAGVVVIVLLCAFPALKILTLALIYNVSAAVLQPLGDSPIIGCLRTIGRSTIYVFAALGVVGLMFFLAITIMITAGNVTAIMR